MNMSKVQRGTLHEGKLLNFFFYTFPNSEEFASHKLDQVVTVTHRDACREGFGLDDVVDAGRKRVYCVCVCVCVCVCMCVCLFTYLCLYSHSTHTHTHTHTQIFSPCSVFGLAQPVACCRFGRSRAQG